MSQEYRGCEIRIQREGDGYRATVVIHHTVHGIGHYQSATEALMAAKGYIDRALSVPPVTSITSDFTCSRCQTVNRAHYMEAASILDETPLQGIRGTMDSEVFCCSCDTKREHAAIGVVPGVISVQEFKRPDDIHFQICIA